MIYSSAYPKVLPEKRSTRLTELTSAHRLAISLEHEAKFLDPDAALDRAELVDRIRKRIETRLPARIRSLHIFVTDHAVVLVGKCNTYHTKQLAQHAAMGVLNYERLINNIDVHS